VFPLGDTNIPGMADEGEPDWPGMTPEPGEQEPLKKIEKDYKTKPSCMKDGLCYPLDSNFSRSS
jgi:hypothetical protein